MAEWATEVRDLANDTLAVAHARGAEHLVNQIMDLGGTLSRPTSVAVIGRRSFGKSRLLAALVGAEVTPSQEREATSTFIQIDAGEETRAFAHLRDGQVREIPLAAIADHALAGGGQAEEVSHLEVLADASLLREGLRLIDTPGLGGLRDEHERVTLQVLDTADALLLIIHDGQPITDEELEIARRARARSEHVVVAANWTDRGDPEIRSFSTRALRRLPGLADVSVVPVSAYLAAEAASLVGVDGESAAALREESGLDALESQLRSVVTDVRSARVRLLLDQTVNVLDELTRPDREVVSLVERGGDPSARARELRDELARLGRIHPSLEVASRMSRLRESVQDEYRAALLPVFRELRDEVTVAWSPELVETLPSRLEARIRELWGEATTRLRDEARIVAIELESALALGGHAGTFVLELERDGAQTLPASYQPGDRVPDPMNPTSRLEMMLRRGLRTMMTVGVTGTALGAAGVMASGFALVAAPLAVPAGLFLAHKEEKAMRARASQQAAHEYLAETQVAAEGLTTQIGARASVLADDLARQFEQRHLGRRETLERSIAQVEEAQGSMSRARERLAEVDPLVREAARLSDRGRPPRIDFDAGGPARLPGD